MNKKWQVMVLLTAVLALAFTLITARQQLQAAAVGGGTAPSLISFQGLLADSNGDPLADGSYDMMFGLYDAPSGGTKIWEETQNSVAVSSGFFAVMLGSGSCTTACPLAADDFSSATRYLQTSVDTGSGFIDFPRQQLGSTPYAFQAEVAPWDGLTGVPAGFADGIDNEGSGAAYENVITVAQSGGDYTSVADALDSITDSSSTNRYLVRVMPGVYTETNLVEVKAYTHLQGSGPNATVVTSSRTGATPGNGAATVDLLDNGRLSHLTIRNEGTGTFGIALYSAETSRETVVDGVVAEAIGVGGTGHYAAYWNDANAIIRNSTLFAGGAVGFGTAVNAAFGSVNIAAGFPQALIENSILMGGSASNLENCNDPSGTGFGLQLSNSSPVVRGSYICGGHRGIALYTNGHAQIQNSSVKVSTTGSAFLFEISASGSIKLANSGVSYLGNKFTGAGTNGLSCAHTYDLGTFAVLTDAINSSANACD
ncbi:MAG: hypothetical protein H6658_06515 [Ardenticatenaceae bacterium]|nr:hypothetical protein [Ardenticatenaceae bacterium]